MLPYDPFATGSRIALVALACVIICTATNPTDAAEHEILIDMTSLQVVKIEELNTLLGLSLGWRASVDAQLQLGVELAGTTDLDERDVENGYAMGVMTLNPLSTEGVSPYMALKGGVIGSNLGPNTGVLAGELGVRLPVTDEFSVRPSFEFLKPTSQDWRWTSTFQIGFSVFFR